MKVEMIIFVNKLDVDCERDESGMMARTTAGLILFLH